MRVAREAMPGASNEREPRPAATDGTAGAEPRAGKILPWPRPASTATISRPSPTAKAHIAEAHIAEADAAQAGVAQTAIADPSPVLFKPASADPVTNLEVAHSFLATLPQRKPARCDLLHKRRVGRALKHRNGRENTPVIVRFPGRHQHRLRLDRHQRRRGRDCADLPHPDLIERPTCVALRMSMPRPG